MTNFIFSELQLAKYLLISLLIFVIFRFLRIAIKSGVFKFAKYKAIDKYIPIIELITWVLFLIWTVSASMATNQIFAISGLLILLYISFWISNFVLKGFVAGMVFRFSGKFRINEAIKLGEYSGRIMRFRNQSLEIETDKGEIIYLPYTKLLAHTNIKADNAETIRSHSFSLNLPNNQQPDEQIQQLRASILQLPWASVKKMPQIAVVEQTTKNTKYKITVFSIEREYFHKIEDYLNQRFLPQTDKNKKKKVGFIDVKPDKD